MESVISEHNFLEYLKKNYPYLWDFEVEIRKVVDESGFGDASASVIVRNKKVFSCDVSHWVKKLYEEKKQV